MGDGALFEVIADGQNVWVNAGWGSVARLSRRRMDVHAPPLGTCDVCGAPARDRPWATFRAIVRGRTGVDLPDWARPTWAEWPAWRRAGIWLTRALAGATWGWWFSAQLFTAAENRFRAMRSPTPWPWIERHLG
jgi:hypothetical protein